MAKIIQLFAAFAGAIHVLFYLMESIFWRNPAVHSVFQVTNQADADLMAVYVENQGYYNLFLAIGMFAGLLLLQRHPTVGKTLIGYISLFMVGAAAVLYFTIPAMITGVFVQGLLPAIVVLYLLAQSLMKR